MSQSPILVPIESNYNQAISNYFSQCSQIQSSEQSIASQQHQLNQYKQILNVQHRNVIASKNAYKCALEAFIKDAYDTSFLGCCADLLCESKECDSIDTATASCSAETYSCEKRKKHREHHEHREHHRHHDNKSRDNKPQGAIRSAAYTGCKSCKK